MTSLLQRLGLAATHRAFDATDRDHLRHVGSGAPVEAAANPGLRVFPSFVRADEVDAVAACARSAIDSYGSSHVSRQHRRYYESQMSHLKEGERPPVNMMRVTGRFESAGQPLAPWGHGDAFDASRLPEPLRRLAERIEADEGLAVGALRDVTINYRRGGFFRLDGHVDPLKDGPNVFILGLLSDTVLTISPVGPPESTTADQQRVALASWSPDDVDVLLRAGSVVHLHGPARDALNHGIRLGVSRRQLEEHGVAADADTMYDWWGTLDRPVRRNDERISIVFAFA